MPYLPPCKNDEKQSQKGFCELGDKSICIACRATDLLDDPAVQLQPEYDGNPRQQKVGPSEKSAGSNASTKAFSSAYFSR